MKRLFAVFIVFVLAGLSTGCAAESQKSVSLPICPKCDMEDYMTELCPCCGIPLCDWCWEEADAEFERAQSSSYEEGYNDGYVEGCGEDEIPDELRAFYTLVGNLMYDYEYETVVKLLEYYPEGVKTALDFEFGNPDISAVIEYLEERAQTVIGNCGLCGELVYADDIAFLPDGITCAHKECVRGDSGNGSYQIK